MIVSCPFDFLARVVGSVDLTTQDNACRVKQVRTTYRAQRLLEHNPCPHNHDVVGQIARGTSYSRRVFGNIGGRCCSEIKTYQVPL